VFGEMSDGTVEGEVVERGEGRVEGAGVVGVGVQEAGGRVVFAFGRRQVSFEEVLERIRANGRQRKGGRGTWRRFVSPTPQSSLPARHFAFADW